MGWDGVERGPEADPQAAEAVRTQAQDEERALRATLRKALEERPLRDYLTRIAMGGSFSSGNADMTAYKEGIRALAVKLLTMGEPKT